MDKGLDPVFESVFPASEESYQQIVGLAGAAASFAIAVVTKGKINPHSSMTLICGRFHLRCGSFRCRWRMTFYGMFDIIEENEPGVGTDYGYICRKQGIALSNDEGKRQVLVFAQEKSIRACGRKIKERR